MAGILERLQSMFRGQNRRDNSDATSLTSDEHCHYPNKAWQKISGHKKLQQRIKLVDVDEPVKENAVRFVCISDTHCVLAKYEKKKIPDGDILLHAGDFSMYGQPEEVNQFNDDIGKLPHQHKLVIAGNHDMTLDEDFMNSYYGNVHRFINWFSYNKALEEYGVSSIRDLLTNFTYLQDSTIQIYGINIYGAPWSPGLGTWGFKYARGSEKCMNLWNKVPCETDVLITHGPPCGFGDDIGPPLWSPFGDKDNHLGCVDLLNAVQQRIKPKYHVFGHIHQGYGMYTDGTTTYVNAAMCDKAYKPVNPPIVFDIPLPPGVTKK